MIVILRRIGGVYYAVDITGKCVCSGIDRQTVAMRAIEHADTIIIDSSFKDVKQE